MGVDLPDKSRLWVSASTCLLSPDEPRYSAILLSLTDVTSYYAARQRLNYAATHDALTGLPNRTHVLDRVGRALASGGREPLSAVIFIDLDNIKIINDSLGHHAGDDVLRLAARRLRAAVRSGDELARLGGDEFIALLANPIAADELVLLAQRLQATLAGPITVDELRFQVSASIGITRVEPDDRRSAAEILRDADAAMYDAKLSGRGQTRFFSDQSLERIPQRRKVSDAVRSASPLR